jgi:mRNA interferase MazF
MRRGEIYWADLNPTIGSEINKIRPVLIISNNVNNQNANTITVLPLTSNVSRVFPFEVLLEKKDSGLTKDCKAQIQQIRTISKLRLQPKLIGKISIHLLSKIEIAIKLHLDME